MNTSTEKTRRRRTWTADEDLVVRYHYPSLNVADLATALGRSVGAVQRRANSLGVLRGARRPLVRTPSAKRSWTADDEDVLRQSWGMVAPATLARQLGRSVVAVTLRKKRLGITCTPNVWCGRAVARLFGVDEHLVLRWIADGLLVARRVPLSFGLHELWHIGPEHIESFIRDHPAAYPADRIAPGYWRRLAMEVRDRDPLLTVEAVARMHWVSKGCIAMAIQQGRLPATRGFGFNRPWFIRTSDARQWRPVRPELIRHRGRGRGRPKGAVA